MIFNYICFSNLVELNILQRIVSKGGLMGAAAKLYLNDREKAKQFIKECSEQCHNKSAQIQWGEELTADIIRFNSFNNDKKT